jgi:formiminoglutamate deiminase
VAADAVFHCELAWLGGEQPVADVRVDVAGGVITGVVPGTDAPPGAVRLTGVTLPGLANAHSHAFHRALRGRTHAGPGTFWTWRDEMYRLASVLDPDSYFRLARATFGEMLLAGITCVGEFHYVHHAPDGTPYAEPNAMGNAIVAAAGEAGLRLTLLDTCYLGSAIAPDGRLQPVRPEQRRFSDGDVHRWAERASQLGEQPGHRVGAAVHSVRAVDPASIAGVAAWASERDRPLHAHVSEQPAENHQCLAAHDLSPIGLLEAFGALSGHFTAVHATHVDAGDVSLLASAGAGVCMCPTTERELADGIAPTDRFRDAGVLVSLGSDSHAMIDLFEEARAVELDERLATLVRGNHRVDDLLRAATAHGHAALGWPEAGAIAVGRRADLVTVSLRSVRTAGTPPSAVLGAVVFAASAADVHDVIVAGERVVAGGHHRSIDVAGELAAAIDEVWRAVEQSS